MKGNYTQQDIECHSLEEVRQRIDELDKVVIKLLAERSQLINQIVKFKKNPAEIDAPERVEEVLNNIKALAKEEDLGPESADSIYRSIINTFRRQQRMKVIPSYEELKKSYY